MAALGLLTALLGCGGNVYVGTGGSGTGGGGTGGWDACGGKACGDDCTPCDPNDPQCELPGTSMYCDANGTCQFQAPACPACVSDADCTFGGEWCVGGECVPCDNSGQLCDIICYEGWSTYSRNGCSPCECAPINDCVADSDCPSAGGQAAKCYAGQFCWDWCPPDDPTCCFGNTCNTAGCDGGPPVGCLQVGCPLGAQCTTDLCSSSSCFCDGAFWSCTDDCGGGTCITPL